MLSDGTWTYSWERGRLLDSMTNGSTTWSYTYNNDGMRVRRTDGTTTYTYFYNGDLLRYVDINGTKLYFVLDASGQPIEVSYVPAGTTATQIYYYVLNQQGDVTAILNTSGLPVVQYTYDAWGNVLSITGSMASTLGTQNPFRYRSYVYDEETGLYYLQSRYYDPEIGRFINADALVSTGQDLLGNNMFAYCGNNPVNRYDPTGNRYCQVSAFDCWGIVTLVCVALKSQAAYYSVQAKEKYNGDTVSVYERGDPNASQKKINAEIYSPSEGTSNISIDKSLEITSGYEMDAILDVIIESEYYSEDVYGSKKFMKAQWVAHNIAHSVASSGDLGYRIMQTLSGSKTPTISSSKLDLRSTNNLLRRQRALYTIISWIC